MAEITPEVLDRAYDRYRDVFAQATEHAPSEAGGVTATLAGVGVAGAAEAAVHQEFAAIVREHGIEMATGWMNGFALGLCVLAELEAGDG